MPSFLEIRSTILDTRVKIDIPYISPHVIDLGGRQASELIQTFTRENVKALCLNALSKVSEFDAVIKREMADGCGAELAWRSGTSLDWVWLEEDTTGKRRDWAVLVGLTLKQVF